MTTAAISTAITRRVHRPAVDTFLIPVLMAAPAMLTLFVWVYYPLFETAWLSFFEWNMMPGAPKTFVGFENYERLLSLPEMPKATLNTIYYTLGLLPLTVALPQR